MLTGPRLGVISRESLGIIAASVVDHSGLVIFLSAVLAGWLMGLLSWVVAAGRDTISQIVIVWMVTAAIGLGHLHHAILGSVEVLGGVFASAERLWVITDIFCCGQRWAISSAARSSSGC